MDTPENKDLIRSDFSRLLIALALSPPASTALQFKYDREDETDDGKADVLNVIGANGSLMDLFIDQKTHRPVMVTYKALMPASSAGNRSGSPRQSDDDSDADRKPPQRNFQIYFSDFQVVSEKGVGDVWLPHRIAKLMDGRTQEEWVIKKFKLNPDLKPKKFERKS